MRKAETLMGVIVVALLILASVLITLGVLTRSKPAPDPSGIWAGLVDDLPSGRMVECVFARDPSGSVAVTCDWANAVRRP